MDQPQPSHPLTRLWNYAVPRRRAMVLASLYSILNKLFDLAPPLLIGAAVDTVVAKQDSLLARFGVQDTGDQLLVLAGVTVAVWVFKSIFKYITSIQVLSVFKTLSTFARSKDAMHCPLKKET